MKKIMLVLGISFVVLSQSVAMSSDKIDTNANTEIKVKSREQHYKSDAKHHEHGKSHKSDYIHKLADIYAVDNPNADKIGMIKFEERDNYSIFFCKENGWCEVLNQKNGNTGWVSLDELKKRQEQYTEVLQKRNGFNQLAQYIRLQDQKIVELQTVIMQMQKELSRVLQNQQTQINQLQKSNYY